MLFASSGSSGLPKCVLVTHAMASSMSLNLSVKYSVILYSAIPAHGPAAIFEIVVSIFTRAIRIITGQLITVDLVLNVLQKYEVNVIGMLSFCATAMAKRMLTETYDLPKLRAIIAGGSTMSEDTRLILGSKLPNVEFRFSYAMSETCFHISCSVQKSKLNSVGYLVDGMSAKVGEMFFFF